MRLYRLGLLDASLGDTTAALRFAASLQGAADSAERLKADALHTFARSIRAHVAGQGGRPAEALEWYRAIAERATYELVYVAPARWRQAWLYAQSGDRARAPDAYGTVARLWGEADPPLARSAAEAARRARDYD